MSKPAPSTPRAKAAAAFIRDLYYNPKLRDQYYAAVGMRTDALKEQQLTKLLKTYNKDCDYTDLGDGWKVLTQQSLLAWQSVYKLDPLGTNPNDDQTSHVIMVSGSRTGASTVVFDNQAVVGLTTGFPNAPTVTWKAASSNIPLNAYIHFDYKKLADPTSDPAIGPRIMNVKLWKSTDPEPESFTHSGHDVFEDIAKFDGTYNTTLVDPGTGDETTGSDIIISVDQPITTDNTAKIGIEVIADDGSTRLKVAQALDSVQNTINWNADNHPDLQFPDSTAAWNQGWLNFSVSYVPPIQGSGNDKPEGATIQQIQGSVWTDSIENAVQIIGTIIPDTAVGDISTHKAYVVGLVTSIGLFALLATFIALAIRKVYKYIQEKKKKKALEEKNQEDPTPENQRNLELSEIQEKAAIDGVDLNRDSLPREVQKETVTDPNDATTYKRATNARGEKLTTYRGAPAYENWADPSGKTVIGDFVKPGEVVPSKELVKSNGAQLDDVSKIPVIKSPIENIETGAKMVVKELGGQFTHSVEVGGFNVHEIITPEGGRLMERAPLEIF